MFVLNESFPMGSAKTIVVKEFEDYPRDASFLT